MERFEIDYRVREVEELAEKEYLQRIQNEKIQAQQRQRLIDMHQELRYSQYNQHVLPDEEIRKKNVLNMFGNTYQSQYMDNNRQVESIMTPNFNNKVNQYNNQDELANVTFEAQVENKKPRKSALKNSSSYGKKKSDTQTNDDAIVTNYKSNEIILNYLNNDDFNFNEKQQRSFVERKIDEQNNEQHNHTNPFSRSSKHCSACLRKKHQEEAQQKMSLYNGINLNALLLECKNALQKRNFKKSEEILISILNKGVDHADVYYLLGETYRLQDKLEEAEKYLLQALLFQFHSPFTYNSLATVYMQQANYERALKLFKKFVEINEEPKAYFNIGVCLVRMKDYLDSVVFFGRAIELDETEGNFYLHRADAYEALGFVDMSLKDYRLFKRFSPQGLNSLLEQHRNLTRQGRQTEANNINNYIKKIQSA